MKRLWKWLMWKRYWWCVKHGKAAKCVYRGQLYMCSKRYKFPKQRIYFSNGPNPLDFSPKQEDK